MPYYLDCEFDGHNGPLMSLGLVAPDGGSLYIKTFHKPKSQWVKENVVPAMGAFPGPRMKADRIGFELRKFLVVDQDLPVVIVTDSPQDVHYFCKALITDDDGSYAPNILDWVVFSVRNVEPYPTNLPRAVQHNALWDAMALKDRLEGRYA